MSTGSGTTTSAPFLDGRRRIIVAATLALAALLLLAGRVDAASPAPAGSRPCPEGPVTLGLLIRLQDEGGPLGDLALAGVGERALGCLGGRELSFGAFVAAPEGLGGVARYRIEPAWLDTWENDLGNFLAAGDLQVVPGAPAGPFMRVAVPPDVQPAFDALRGQWATVTGHFDDPAASSCRGVLTPQTSTAGRIPSPEELVELCRTSFVVTAIEPGPDLCPTDPDLAAIRSVPEDHRAACFGRSPLSFEAWGWTLMNVWPGVQVPDALIGDFALGETPGPDGLWVFLPGSVPLPDPEGTPWEQRDGIAPGDAWWRVTGHFDDPRAQGCVPRAGDTIDDVPVVMSGAEVLAFCRNHFVIERLEWIPSGPASREGPTSTGTPQASGMSTTDGMPDEGIDRDPSWVLVPALLVAGGLVLLAAVVVRILGRRR